MRNLLQLLLKYNSFLLFLLLEIISFTLIFNKNRYQQSVIFNATSDVASAIYNVTNSAFSYFNLRNINDQLAQENAKLQNEIIKLQNQLETSNDSNYIPADNDIEYIPCKIINNSINKANNYITLNKGKRDNVDIDMGVVGPNGVVGIVIAASDKFSIVESILNNKSSINARLSRTNEVGQIKWDGIDYQYAYLHDIARHVSVNKGDTIVTSGFSTIFPKDIMIGTVEEIGFTNDDGSYNIKVRLSSDLKNLRHVMVIKNNNAIEIENLQKTIKN